MSLALRNSLGACKAESLIEIFLVYQIPLRDIVSKVVLLTLTFLSYQRGYFYLKIDLVKVIFFASFKGDSP